VPGNSLLGDVNSLLHERGWIPVHSETKSARQMFLKSPKSHSRSDFRDRKLAIFQGRDLTQESSQYVYSRLSDLPQTAMVHVQLVRGTHEYDCCLAQQGVFQQALHRGPPEAGNPGTRRSPAGSPPSIRLRRTAVKTAATQSKGIEIT
jgi:hypothetical protein